MAFVLFPDVEWDRPMPSFALPVADPGSEPDQPPFVCVSFNQAWLPLVAGCMLQLTQAASWQFASDLARDDLLRRATTLFNRFGTALACLGEASVLIVADGFDTPPDPVYEESGIDFLYAA